MSQIGNLQTTQVAADQNSEFLKFQQLAKEEKERERILQEQIEQRQKAKEAEDLRRRLEAEELTKQRERYGELHCNCHVFLEIIKAPSERLVNIHVVRLHTHDYYCIASV